MNSGACTGNQQHSYSCLDAALVVQYQKLKEGTHLFFGADKLVHQHRKVYSVGRWIGTRMGRRAGLFRQAHRLSCEK